MTDLHPLMQIYVYGIYGWLTVLAFSALLRPHQFKILMDDQAKQAGMTPKTLMAIVTVAYTFGWPLTALVMLADAVKNGRGDGR